MRRFLGTVLMAVLAPVAAAAQSAGTGSASPLLPPGHWAVEAAARAEAIGLAPGYLPAQSSVPRSTVAAALREAAETAGATGAAGAPNEARTAAGGGIQLASGRRVDPTVASMAAGWWRRFREEFPEFDVEHASALLGGSAAVGVEARDGAAGPGVDEFPPDRTGATPLPGGAQGVVRTEVAAALGGWGTIHATGRLGTEGSRLERGEAAVGWRNLRASMGRAEIGWGVGRGGGVVFSGSVPLDRIELSSASPARLPSVLGLLGPFAFQAFAAPLPDDRHPGSPWLLGATASAKPHPRFTLSGHRALLAGGAGVEQRMGAGELLAAIIGKNVVGVNQIASTSFRLRLPTEAVAPLAVYCEWGAEDSAGAPFDAPGLICGGASASLPLAPYASLGVEHAQFGARPVNGPPWYRHHMFPGNWATDEAPLGHPLGGEGRQWLVYSEVTALGGMLELDARGFLRERTGENLYLPGRAGESRGVAAGAVWRIDRRLEIELRGSTEAGDGWVERRARVYGRVMF